MDRVRTGVFYYCPVCDQPSGSSIPQSECLTCAANRSGDFTNSPPRILRSPGSTATTLSLLSSDDEDELTSLLLLRHTDEHNYGALDLVSSSRRWRWEAPSEADSTEHRLAATSTSASVHTDADTDGGSLVASRHCGRCHAVVWLLVALGFWAVIGAGILLIVLP
ncbi:uncharacterized protein MAM_01756 [Metarhizium album ARSEF 1941]|uniref:Uncharacterized protein n=1 Tax=Metarhizium album (strain ARSEF 1941) TaxID=1081103 RepID=A0A0B2X5E2_METAS|nr:uncharacterized protein MAM_01756 [Metarhizium album ARSEF 1941]KHO00978.1 hypothetical protein MAM_01756 [Metarhizium album ARSEF 1941]